MNISYVILELYVACYLFAADFWSKVRGRSCSEVETLLEVCYYVVCSSCRIEKIIGSKIQKTCFGARRHENAKIVVINLCRLCVHLQEKSDQACF